MQDYEKLGVFYLGKVYDPDKRKVTDDLILYDSKDLVTHAVCIGMTGSGKTGLCLGLLEEALIDGIPALIVDPKGDLANLLLTFPDLRPEDFAPWVDEDEARRKGLSVEDFAAAQAQAWTKGLSDWGQDGERIRRLRQAADMVVYTPGSNAGQPLAVLKSFNAPPEPIAADAELLGERISATATSLLALLGITADPMRSREHILLSKILERTWADGQDLDLGALIQQVQTPPVQKVGAFDVDTFFPPADRFALAMQLNNLLAAPGFDAWTQGAPLDVGSLLYTPSGKPRAAILSIAHLSDAERMFFVSLLLNETVAWMRTQSGTTSLRAILYMDEIFGYLPPVANPPSKQPLLTLLKQARAFGLGVVLATQNPVDLDYKGLSNTGTWFIGRLQTERDKARVLEGLEGAAAGSTFDRKKMDHLLTGLDNRVFLMNNVHDDAPVVFHARWAMSYLRGPLTREQIKRVSATSTVESAAPQSSPRDPSPPRPSANAAAARPAIPPQIKQFFLSPRTPAPAEATLLYDGMLLGAANVYLADNKLGIETTEQVRLLAAFKDEAVAIDWNEAAELAATLDDLKSSPEANAAFVELLPAAADPKSYGRWESDLKRWLQTNFNVELKRSPSTRLVSQPGEDERDFRIRLRDAAREVRDDKKTKLREKYGAEKAKLDERQRRAEQAVAREDAQASQQTWQTAISVGSTVLNAFLGRRLVQKGTMGSAATAARSASRTMKEREDVARARENAEAVQRDLEALDARFIEEVATLEAQTDAGSEELEPIKLKPRKTDVAPQLVTLAWAPYWIDSKGGRVKAW